MKLFLKKCMLFAALNLCVLVLLFAVFMLIGDQYLGKRIKARGSFGYYKDENTGEEYFAVVISDAAGCCSQGIEFVLDGEYRYPEDYPEPGTDITVTGIFDHYTDALRTREVDSAVLVLSRTAPVWADISS